VEWFNLALDREEWKAVVNTVLKLGVAEREEDLLSSPSDY
jgi:hypothetical protein